MPRNAEVIRQWTILRELESSRRATIQRLADLTGVTTRTIRRDLEALQQAGFPLYDEAADGRKFWRLDTRPFKGLRETGFTVAELSALYFSRRLMNCLAGTPFQEALETAFGKLEAALTPRMREFLDRLPAVLAVKTEPAPRLRHVQREHIARLLDAILHQRRVAMRYHSFTSRRQKDYIVDPHRLVYAHGGLYLFAYVPAYKQARTFALERIRALSPLQEAFESAPEAAETPFAHSLGIYEGVPERVKLWFSPKVAPYVQERVWHPTQQLEPGEDGSVVMSMEVCADQALRSWILSFGSGVRVLAPPDLARQVAGDLRAAGALYESALPEMPAQ